MKLRLLFLFGLILTMSSCTKNRRHPVPNVPFDITINMSLPSYNALIGVGGVAYVNGGSKGIIVYHRGVDDFVAFDRHSPLDELAECNTPLYPDTNNYLILLDDCNDAQFSLYDGSPITESEFGLRQYQTMWDGNQALRIFN